MPENKSKTLCIYHGNCADGFGAAWVVRKALGANVEFVPGVYGQEPPDVAGKDVVLVDFSYKYDVLAELAWRAKSIIVLDHHKSAAEDLGRFEQFHAGIEEDTRRDDGTPLLGWRTAHAMANSQNGPSIACCFDMNRSGQCSHGTTTSPTKSLPSYFGTSRTVTFGCSSLKAREKSKQTCSATPTTLRYGTN